MAASDRAGRFVGERLERCRRRTGEAALLDRTRMGETMAAFIDTLLAEQRGEPVGWAVR